VPESAGPPVEGKSATTGSLRPPIDLRALNELIDGDNEFARDLAATFIESGEQQIAEMQLAAAQGDRETLARTAHKLKGACANIHAQSLQAMAHRLEIDSETAEAGALEPALMRLRQEFERAKRFLTDPEVIAQPAKAAS